MSTLGDGTDCLNRFFDEVEGVAIELRPTHPTLDALALKGIFFQERLRGWYDGVMPLPDHADGYPQLALANYHALCLFLCRNYAYYTCWEDRTVPYMSPPDAYHHISSILDICSQISNMSHIPGFILLFPLRVIGAHAAHEIHRSAVIDELTQVYRRGFIVAERIKVDLRQLWDFQARLGEWASAQSQG